MDQINQFKKIFNQIKKLIKIKYNFLKTSMDFNSLKSNNKQKEFNFKVYK